MFRKLVGLVALAYVCNFGYNGTRGMISWWAAADNLSEINTLESKIVKELSEFDESVRAKNTDGRKAELNREVEYNKCLQMKYFRKALAFKDYKKIDCEDLKK